VEGVLKQAKSPGYGGVDILLTSEWGHGVTLQLPPNAPLPTSLDMNTVGSGIVSGLASVVRPRYHFVGTEGRFYERLPYRRWVGGRAAGRAGRGGAGRPGRGGRAGGRAGGQHAH
jgi:hypothetical protein